MSRFRAASLAAALIAALTLSAHGQQPATPGAQPPSPSAAQQPIAPDQPARFKSGIELINVTATVSDANGRFVPGLTKDDFQVYEDNQRQEVTVFSAERVPVSLGIALDTSGSMEGEKMRAAESALNRFLYQLLAPTDEIFLYRFSNFPVLLQGWTTDRQLLARALGRIEPEGGTALYDTVAEAVPLAQQGQNVKKALVIISDGNDTASRTDIGQVRTAIRQSEVLVYAVGIDAPERDTYRPMPRRPPIGIPFPFPPGGGRGGWPPMRPPRGPGGYSGGAHGDDRVNEGALRDMTDDSGGRTEIIRDPRDLNPATAGIADELSKQYYLAYPSSGKKDGKWHSIRVEVRNPTYHVRARRGYVAS